MPIYNFKSFLVLNELVKIGPDEQNGFYVIQFDKWLYVINPDVDNSEVYKKIFNELGNIDINNSSFKRKPDDEFFKHVSIEKFIKMVTNEIFDVFIGKIENYNLVSLSKFNRDNVSSIVIKKILKQLNILNYVVPKDYKDFNYHNKELSKGEVPDIGFHGTSSKYVENILKVGIVPQPKNTWGVDLKNLVFFSTSKFQPLFHALRLHDFEDVYNTVPVIIEFNIPSKENLVQDFDMEQFTGKQDIYDIIGKRFTINRKAFSLSKEFGLYGYRGTIKPNYIKGFWVPDKELVNINYKSLDNYIFIDKKKMLEFLNSYFESNL